MNPAIHPSMAGVSTIPNGPVIVTPSSAMRPINPAPSPQRNDATAYVQNDRAKNGEFGTAYRNRGKRPVGSG